MSTQTTASADTAASNQTRPFAFRPSKLSAVTEQIWRKDGCSSGANPTQHQENLNLLEKPSLKCSQESTSSIEKSVSSTNRSFVFGQKISERVVIKDTSKDQHDNKQSELKISDFKSLQRNGFENPNIQPVESEDKSKPTLEESAKEYEETISANSKVKLAENTDVKTGEEEELNIMQIICKLHVFDGSKQSWEERGNAVLRLNEVSEHCTKPYSLNASNIPTEDHKDSARIVVRLAGSLKVVVNSRLWNDMLIERVSPKRLKLSAMDYFDKSVILYLVTATQPEIDKLEQVLKQKLEILNDKQKETTCKRKQDETDHRSEKKLKVTPEVA